MASQRFLFLNCNEEYASSQFLFSLGNYNILSKSPSQKGGAD